LALCILAGTAVGFDPAAAEAGEGGSISSTASEGQTYSLKTPWAVLKVKRVEGPDSFETWVSSDVPLDGWLLTKKGSRKTLGRKNLNAVYEFNFKIPQSFSEDLVLTVFPIVDGSPQPLVVSWSDGNPPKGGAPEGEVDPWLQWHGDSSRPYNRVVQGLFLSAVKSYRVDRSDEAMKGLDKALTLDPSNPQVLDLREKILEGAGSPTRRKDLREARALLKKGKSRAALEITDALLAKDAKDSEALNLKKQIETVLDETNARPAKKTRRTRSKSAAPSEDPEARGRADQAYNLGLESYRKGNWGAAKSFWEQALQNDPHYLQAQRALDRLKSEQPSMK
jgi:tetratricopeptide (TPR) repeat protein